MKLIQLANIAGDIPMLERVSRAIKKHSDAEVVAVTGGLAGNVLDEKAREYFVALLDKFRPLRNMLYRATDKKVRSVREAARGIIDGKVNFDGLAPDVVEQEKKYANDYLEYETQKKEGMRKQYEEMRDIFEAMPQKVVLIPGRGDGKCLDDSLGKFNLHNRKNKNVRVKGVHFVGYGGTRFIDSEIPDDVPEEWLVPFDEGTAYKHLVDETEEDRSSIALVHTPVSGYEGKGSRVPGSTALLAYMNLRQPDAVLQGCSMPWMKRDNRTGTMIVNSGSLGNTGNKKQGGTFVELDYDEEGGWVKPYRAYQILGDHEVRVVAFEKTDRNELTRKSTSN